MSKKQYAVIGLGRFGMSIATKLADAGNEVLAIDLDEGRIDDVKQRVTHAVIADSTDDVTLKSIGIHEVDTVIVAIGDDIQSSILTVLVLKELGVSKVIAKALNNRHGEVLKKVGADVVVFPERDMGERVANQLMSPNVLNYIELAKGFSIEEVKIPARMAGKSLRDLDLRAKYNVSVIATNNNGEILVSPHADKVLNKDDLLVVIGENKDLKKFSNLI